MSKLKVNVVVAGRTYPLSVGGSQEEEGLRKAAKDINSLIAKYEQNYAVADKQDVLAMCALHFASNSAVTSLKINEANAEAIDKIDSLTNLLTNHLE